MGNKVTCKKCGGAKGVHEPRSGVWLSVCDYCDGKGEVDIYSRPGRDNPKPIGDVPENLR
jgi:DnaJ-class molecular chaperone